MLKTLSIYLSVGIISATLSVIATFILTHTLSPAQYGMGMLFTSLIAMIATVCGMGMDCVFLRYFYEKNYQDRASFLLYICLFFIVFGIFIVFVVGSFFTSVTGKVFHLKGWLIWCLLTTGEIVFILQIFSSLIPRLYAKPSLYAIGQIFQKTTFLIAVVMLLLLTKKNSMVIIISQLISLGVCSFVLIYCYRNIWKFPTGLLQQLKFNHIKKLLYYGLPFSFSNSLALIFFNIDKFFLLKLSNSNELGIYTAAFVLSAPLETARSLFILAWMPRCHQLISEMPFKGKKIFHDTFHQALWVFTVMISVLILLKSVLVLFLGNKFHSAENIFGWLLLSIYFFGISDIVTAGILKSKKTYWNIIISLICLITNIIACYCLIPHLGAHGAAIANAISFCIFFLMRYIIGFQYYAFKIFRLKLFLYGAYLCGAITLSAQNVIEWQLLSMIIFILLSLWLEKKWLIKYFQKVYWSICRRLIQDVDLA